MGSSMGNFYDIQYGPVGLGLGGKFDIYHQAPIRQKSPLFSDFYHFFHHQITVRVNLNGWWVN